MTGGLPLGIRCGGTPFGLPFVGELRWVGCCMPDYRRFRVAGGTYFFTVNLLERRLDTLVRHIDALREAVRATRRERPFRIDAWVVLPDHLHCIWTLPPGDDDFSNRWKAIKIRFVQTLPRSERRSPVRTAKGERGIWQRRSWEHAIRDERDYAGHVDYIHYNPVKHGCVARVADWPHSTFHRYVQRCVYPPNWAGTPASEFETGEKDDGLPS
jgi:putative transposase